MSQKRKVYSPKLRSQVALAAVRGDKTIHEVAQRYGVSPQMVIKMKSRLLDRIEELFQDGRTTKKKSGSGPEMSNEELVSLIGHLEIENEWLKKKLPSSTRERRLLIDPKDPKVSIFKQCKYLNLHRSTYYFHPRGESAENLLLMEKIDRFHMENPALGSRMIAAEFRISRDRARRLMGLMGINAVYPVPRTSRPEKGHEIYPYLLRNLEIKGPNHVWSADITYIPMRHGFVYMTSVMDWFSRHILSWDLSNTLDRRFCIEALEMALSTGFKPEIFNTDQGSQYTSVEFTGILKKHGIRISMDGRGRALDNVFIERFWRTVKYELIYINEFETV